jgi:hypothetical protein
MRKQLARAGAVLGIAMTSFPLLAMVANASVPSIFRDAQNNVYIMGQSPQTRVSLTYNGMLRSRDYQANSCGWVTLRNSSTNPISGTIVVGGTNVDTSSLPTQLLPTCTNGTPQETRNANFKTSTGDVVIVGRTAGSYVTVQVPQNRDRAGTANACGFVRFTNSTTYQHQGSTNIGFGGSYSGEISNLEQRDAPLCSRGSLYVPASWLGGS